MDIRDIYDPFAVSSFCVKIPIHQIFISVNLLSKLLPLPASAYFRQQSVCFHKSEDSFRISVTAVFVQPQMHPAIAICIFAPLLLPGDLVYNRLIWVRTVDRKSTRLNSSHVSISYAVFCWNKKSARSS